MSKGPVNFDWWDVTPLERGFFFDAGESDQDEQIPDYISRRILYSDLPGWITHGATVRSHLQGYRLVKAEKSGMLQRRFYFMRPRTDTERATPIKTVPEKRMWSWPTVLLKLWAEKGLLPNTAVGPDGNPVSVDSWHERLRYRRGDTLPTWFKISEYVSDEPFKMASQQMVPITDPIHWSVDGFSGSVPECLHPRVTVPTINTSSRKVLWGFGTEVSEIGGDLNLMEFPATPMTDWEKYVVEDMRRPLIEGGIAYHRTVAEALPPIDDREILA